MRTTRILAFLIIATLAVWSAYSSDDVAELRGGGQAAVDALHAQWRDANPAERAQLEAKLDRVCGQKDCSTSRLYWYADLDAAQEAARRAGKPLLSLHLLGRLDQELSCANSRFFRVMLYSDETIASILRDDFILHWHSVRPVPQVTIDMGDGRTIRQTVTGNSAHYLLDADGNVLDVLPGLYSPKAFRAQLEAWLELHRAYDPETLRAYHERRVQEISARGLELGILEMRRAVVGKKRPMAEQVLFQAQSKAMTERSLLSQLSLGARRMLPEQWDAVGERELAGVEFSPASIELMRRKQPVTDDLLLNLRRTVAADTLFNEVELHRIVHEWFAAGEVGSLEALNERVYDELFFTPSDDPWLGLRPNSVFMAVAAE